MAQTQDLRQDAIAIFHAALAAANAKEAVKRHLPMDVQELHVGNSRFSFPVSIAFSRLR